MSEPIISQAPESRTEALRKALRLDREPSLGAVLLHATRMCDEFTITQNYYGGVQVKMTNHYGRNLRYVYKFSISPDMMRTSDAIDTDGQLALFLLNELKRYDSKRTLEEGPVDDRLSYKKRCEDREKNCHSS